MENNHLKTSKMWPFNFSINFKKIYLRVCSFTSNKKQKNMTNFNDHAHMKSTIFLMAQMLLLSSDTTTTLDVKNAIHNVYPGIELCQVEVSTCMDELLKDGKFQMTFNGTYREYSLAPSMNPVSADTDTDTATGDLTQPSSPDVQTVDPHNLQAAAAVSPQSVVVGAIGQHPVDFLKKLDENVRVAYTAGKNNFMLTNQVTHQDARKLFKAVTREKHDDVRTISLKTYLRRNNLI